MWSPVLKSCTCHVIYSYDPQVIHLWLNWRGRELLPSGAWQDGPQLTILHHVDSRGTSVDKVTWLGIHGNHILQCNPTVVCASVCVCAHMRICVYMCGHVCVHMLESHVLCEWACVCAHVGVTCVVWVGMCVCFTWVCAYTSNLANLVFSLLQSIQNVLPSLC